MKTDVLLRMSFLWDAEDVFPLDDEVQSGDVKHGFAAHYQQHRPGWKDVHDRKADQDREEG